MFYKRSVPQIHGWKPIPIPSDDLYICLSPLLKFGQIVGLCPYSKVWSRRRDYVPIFRLKSPLIIPSIVIITLMTINVMMNFAGMVKKIISGQSSPIKLSWAIQMPMFYSVGLYTYIHFTRHGQDLCELLIDWREQCRQMRYIGQVDRRVRWKIQFFAWAVMSSAILENVVYHTRVDCKYQSKCHQTDDNSTELEEYYYREHRENWVHIISYQPVVAVLLFIVNKLTIIATNFADIIIISLAWAVASKFQQLISQIEIEIKNQTICWTQVRKDFMTLHDIFQKVSALLSPLIFLSYTLLVELISTQIHLGITTDSKRPTMDKIYSIWSFIHLIVRLLLISIVSSRIMERCQDMLYLVQKCPSGQYDNEVERLEKVVTTPVCLTGSDCFKVNKSFILSVIHVIFTCEIIFLQSEPPTKSK